MTYLSSATLSALLTSRQIGRETEQINRQLASGLRITSPLDGARDFYLSRALQEKADFLKSTGKQIVSTQSLLRASMTTVTSMIDGLESARSILDDMLAGNAQTRSDLAQNYREQLVFVLDLAQDNRYLGVNLLAGESHATYFNELRTSEHLVEGLTLNTLEGLQLSRLDDTVYRISLQAAKSGEDRGNSQTLLSELDDKNGNNLNLAQDDVITLTTSAGEKKVLTLAGGEGLNDFARALENLGVTDITFAESDEEPLLSFTVRSDRLPALSVQGKDKFADIFNVEQEGPASEIDSALTHERDRVLASIASLEAFAHRLALQNENLNTRLTFSEAQASTLEQRASAIVEADPEELTARARELALSSQFAIAGISATISQRELALQLLLS